MEFSQVGTHLIILKAMDRVNGSINSCTQITMLTYDPVGVCPRGCTAISICTVVNCD